MGTPRSTAHRAPWTTTTQSRKCTAGRQNYARSHCGAHGECGWRLTVSWTSHWPAGRYMTYVDGVYSNSSCRGVRE